MWERERVWICVQWCWNMLRPFFKWQGSVKMFRPHRIQEEFSLDLPRASDWWWSHPLKISHGDHHPKQETTNVPNYQEMSCPFWIDQPWPTGLCLLRPSAIWAGTTKLMPWSSCWIHVFGGFHVASDVTNVAECHMVPQKSQIVSRLWGCGYGSAHPGFLIFIFSS